MPQGAPTTKGLVQGGQRRDTENPHNERSRACGVREAPAHTKHKTPRERYREDGDRERGQRHRSRSPCERSCESGNRGPTPDIKKSGVSQK
ncbi:hypothetical protein PoB_007311900 [Plakobranchus ocellatus]|uniref:Uncharacterized protein n=1 Tax=Plakobranchus ocellatus TaxID=259542 RepID=A0AAV4DQX7_9GAST|nr:hypothetical protein PoB_007311900 [Plakobranchus ocellatus]